MIPVLPPRASGRRPARPARRLALLGAALAACQAPGAVAPPPARPAGDEGMVIYAVGKLAFEAPADWIARGDARHLAIEPEDHRALLDVRLFPRSFESERACLDEAEAALARGAAEFNNVRRHTTTFAGKTAVTQEADQGPWHGWAYAVCDGGTQYRVFFSGRSPLAEEDIAAWQVLVASAQLGEGP